MTKLKIAFVGLGNQFISDYFHFLKNLPEYIEISALCDINPEKTHLAKQLEVNFYDNYKKMIDTEKIDILILILPHALYFDIIKYGAQNHIHIFKEKPFATSISEATEFIKLQKIYNIQIHTVMKRRQNPLYKLCKKHLNAIGKIKKIIINHVLNVKDPLLGWRGSFVKAKGGCILDLGYHMIDIINWFFGLPEKIYSKRFIFNPKNCLENTALIFFEYTKNQIEGQLLISREHYKKNEEIIIIGENKTIYLKKNMLSIGNKKYAQSSINDNQNNLTISSLLDFCNSIKNKTSNFTPIDEQLFNVIFIQSCYTSLQTNSCIETNLIYKEPYEQFTTSTI